MNGSKMKNEIRKIKFLPDMELKDGRVMKRFELPIAVNKAFDPSAPLNAEGYANYAVPDRGGEVMPPACFDLTNYKSNPIVLFDHDYCRPVGRAMVLEPKEEGFYVNLEVGNPAAGHELTADQKMVRSLLAQKVLTSMSVGFIPHEWEIDEKSGVLTYKRVELLEISIVSVPMQQNSQFVNVKDIKESDMSVEKELPPKEPEAPEAEGSEGEPKEPVAGEELIKALASAMQENTEICKSIYKMCEEMKGMKPAEEPKEPAEGEEPKEDEEKKSLESQVVELQEYVKELEARLEKFASIFENQEEGV
jgi:HK97 family phage prohead protease